MTVKFISEELKRKIAEVAKTSPLTRPELAKRFGISTRTLYRVLKECADKPIQPVEQTVNESVWVKPAGEVKSVGYEVGEVKVKFVTPLMIERFGRLFNPKSLSIELRKVYEQLDDPAKLQFQKADTLMDAFNWHGSPQGGEFWVSLDKCMNGAESKLPPELLKRLTPIYRYVFLNNLCKETTDKILNHWYSGNCSVSRFVQVVKNFYGINLHEYVKNELNFRKSRLTRLELDAIAEFTVNCGQSVDWYLNDLDGELFRQEVDEYVFEILPQSFELSKICNTIVSKTYKRAYSDLICRIAEYTDGKYVNRYNALSRQVYYTAYNNSLELDESRIDTLHTVLEMIDPKLKDVCIAIDIARKITSNYNMGQTVRELVRGGVTERPFPYSIKFPVVGELESRVKKFLFSWISDGQKLKVKDMAVYKTLHEAYGVLHPDRSLKTDLTNEIVNHIMNGNMFDPINTFDKFVNWDKSILGKEYWVKVITYRPELEQEHSPYVITPSSVSFSYGGKAYVVNMVNVSFREISKLVIDGKFAEAAKLSDNSTAITEYMDNVVEIKNSVITYCGFEIKNALTMRILTAMREGDKVKLDGLIQFFKLLMENPDKEVIDDLFTFLEASDIEIDSDGYILAYKKVRSDYKDLYTGKIDNSVGCIVKMPRWMISKDRNVACAEGLHVCSKSYLPSYHGSDNTVKYVVCKIHPRDVVSIPVDHSFQKMRVCKYEVIKDVTKIFRK